ncbi:condensation domain-containing protein [Streptomyces sp. NPDC049687]|uniref:condensation domain-containing protein n=1 Tax=Streptomyces sp. NPDC049687 TaxID=3365596 RepID=UPI00378AA356
MVLADRLTRDRSRRRRWCLLTPLSYGQLSVLRSIEHIPRHEWSSANIARWLPLRPGVTLEEIRAAIELLPRRHESLRTVYRLPVDATPTQRIEERATGVVESAEIEGTDEAASALVDASRERPFTLEDDFGWRATIATTGGLPRGIALCVHHIAADGWAQDLIERDLSPVLAAPRPGPQAAGYDTVGGPLALAVEQRSDAWREQRLAARRFHGEVLRSGLLAPAPLAPGERLRELPPRYDGELPLDHLAAALAERARGLRLFPQALLLTAAALTTAVCFGELSAAWWLMTSNRFNPRWSDLVTSMNQVVPMHADLAADATVADLAQRLQASSADALRYGCYDVDEINALSREIIGGLPLWRYMFNYAVGGAISGPPDGGHPDDIPYARPRTSTCRRSAAAACYFVVSDEPHLILRYCTTLADADEPQVAALLRTYETLLRQVLLRPELPVRRLLDTVGDGLVGGGPADPAGDR